MRDVKTDSSNANIELQDLSWLGFMSEATAYLQVWYKVWS